MRDIRYIQERIQDGDIEVSHILFSENLTDICTKPLPQSMHNYLIGLMGLKPNYGRASQGEC